LELRRHLSEERHKSITLLRDSFDVLLSGWPFSESLSKDRNCICKITLVYDDIGPDGAKQRLLSDESAVVTNEREQRVKGLGGQGYWLTITQEAALIRFHSERSELVNDFGSGHGGLQI
jgi:hypothetical protein